MIGTVIRGNDIADIDEWFNCENRARVADFDSRWISVDSLVFRSHRQVICSIEGPIERQSI